MLVWLDIAQWPPLYIKKNIQNAQKTAAPHHNFHAAHSKHCFSISSWISILGKLSHTASSYHTTNPMDSHEQIQLYQRRTVTSTHIA
jgi:hypothetical protein